VRKTSGSSSPAGRSSATSCRAGSAEDRGDSSVETQTNATSFRRGSPPGWRSPAARPRTGGHHVAQMFRKTAGPGTGEVDGRVVQVGELSSRRALVGSPPASTSRGGPEPLARPGEVQDEAPGDRRSRGR
jgi:hypothetical protein